MAAFVATIPDLVAQIGEKVRPATADLDDAAPYLTYQGIDGQTIGGLDGPSGLADRRLQVNVVGSSYGQANFVARLLVGTRDEITDLPTGFDGFRGTLDGVDVRRVRLVDWRDNYEMPEAAEQRGIYEIQLDFMIAFDEATVSAGQVGG